MASNAQSSCTPGSPKIVSSPSAFSWRTSACPPVITGMFTPSLYQTNRSALTPTLSQRERGSLDPAKTSICLLPDEPGIVHRRLRCLASQHPDHFPRRVGLTFGVRLVGVGARVAGHDDVVELEDWVVARQRFRLRY